MAPYRNSKLYNGSFACAQASIVSTELRHEGKFKAMQISRRTALQGAGALTMAGMRNGVAAPADGTKLRLRLIGTSDLHTNVFSYDYFRDKPDDTVGLAKTATLIRNAMAEASNSLLFDNGDIIQGTPFGDYAALAMGLKKGDIHPMIAAMNAAL